MQNLVWKFSKTLSSVAAHVFSEDGGIGSVASEDNRKTSRLIWEQAQVEIMPFLQIIGLYCIMRGKGTKGLRKVFLYVASFANKLPTNQRRNTSYDKNWMTSWNQWAYSAL